MGADESTRPTLAMNGQRGWKARLSHEGDDTPLPGVGLGSPVTAERPVAAEASLNSSIVIGNSAAGTGDAHATDTNPSAANALDRDNAEGSHGPPTVSSGAIDLPSAQICSPQEATPDTSTCHDVSVKQAGDTIKSGQHTTTAKPPCDLEIVLKETKLVLIFGDDEFLTHLAGQFTIDALVKTVEGLFEEELKGKEVYRIVVDPNDIQHFQSSAQGRTRVILRPGYAALYDRFLEILQSQHVLGHRQFEARVHVRELGQK